MKVEYGKKGEGMTYNNLGRKLMVNKIIELSDDNYRRLKELDKDVNLNILIRLLLDDYWENLIEKVEISMINEGWKMK